MDGQSAVHGGCVQQREAGHRREYFAGCGFFQQGEVCLGQRQAAFCGKLVNNCPQAVNFHVLQQKKRHSC